MSKMTLLEMTQDILRAMDSDEISSIGDTVESLQVAGEVKIAYEEIFANLKLPFKSALVQLQALSDLNHPNYLQIPDTVKSIGWIKYNTLDYTSFNVTPNQNLVYDTEIFDNVPVTVDTSTVPTYVDIQYQTPEMFILNSLQYGGQLNTQVVVDFSGAQLTIGNQYNPTYWTTFDNKNIVFDSYNSTLDATLQQSKTMCWGQYDLTFEMQDTFIPDLDAGLFPLLLAEAKRVSFVNQKQVSSQPEEQRARRQLVRAQNDLWRADQRRPYDMPNYGRRRSQTSYSPPPRRLEDTP